MKVLTGHLTSTEKKHISLLLEKNISQGRVNRKSYFLTELPENEYLVTIKENNRGMIPVPGSALRISSYTSTFKLR